MPDSIDAFTLDLFAPHVGSVFAVPLADGGSYPLTLAEATAIKTTAGPSPHREPFELQFSGPGPAYLAQGTYLLRHAALGELTMFLVPIGASESGIRYQAVHN